MVTNKVPASPGLPAEQPLAEVFADSRVQELEVALAQKTREHDTACDQLLRLMADFDNYRKRIRQQFEQIKQEATTDLVRELLPRLDNLERALNVAHQDATPSSMPIAEGVSLILRQFNEILAKVGVRAFEVQGQLFDPARHEAVGAFR
jgi:molecular chaperone GrpE